MSTTTLSASAPISRVDQQWLGRYLAYTFLALGLIRLIPAISFTSFHNDFSHYYIGGSMFAGGINVYTENLEPYCQRLGAPYDPTIPYAAHPPLILAFFSLFAWLPPTTAYAAWLVVQFACLFGCVELTRRILNFRWDSPQWLFMVAIFTNAICVQLLFYYSQVQLLVAVMMYGALYAHLNGRSAAACGIITVAAAFKLYPAVLLVWFFFSGLRGLSDGVRRTSIIALAGVGCLVLPGIQTWIDFLTLGLPALSDNATKWCNFSVQNLFFMLARTPLGQILAGHSPGLVKLAATAGSLVVLGSAFGLVWLRRLDRRVAFSILLVATMVSGIITWSHYLSVLFLPVAILWSAAGTLPNQRLKMLAYLSGGLLLTPKLDCIYFDLNLDVARVLVHFYPLYTAWLVALLLAFAITHVRHPDDTSPTF